MGERQWETGLQRSVLACAIRGELLSKIPGSVNPDLFGSSSSPRRQIAECVSEYWDTYLSRPTAELIDEYVQRRAGQLSAPERNALLEEWTEVVATELPESPEAIYDPVRKRLEYQRLTKAIREATEILVQDPDAVDAAREKLLPEDIQVQGNDKIWRFQADLEERLAIWRDGDGAYGKRVPTGLAALDIVLKGGPTLAESWYFLAPPKGAKTTCLLTCAASAIRRGYGVYFATFEMRAVRMMLRFDRTFSKLSKKELQEGDGEQWLKRAIAGLQAIQGGELYVEAKMPQQPGSVREAAARVREIRKQGGRVDVVILDYLNIMGSSKNEREKRHELARISRDMSAMAKDLNVLVWSAALVNRQSVNRRTIRKTDIAEAFEVIAVADGVVAISGTKAMVQNRYRRLFVAAAREEQDEAMAGSYRVDFDRMVIEPANEDDVKALLEREERGENTDPEEQGGTNGDNPS